MTPHIPSRGDEFAAWLRARRDEQSVHTHAYNTLDRLLDDYRLHADTRTPLHVHVCEGGNPDDCHGCWEETQRSAPEPVAAPQQMSDERLNEISARHAAATPGPWWSDDSESCWRLHGVHAELPPPFPGFPPQILNHQILKAPKRNTPFAEYWPNEADAALISNAWQDERDLLTEVHRLRDEVNAVRAELDAVRGLHANAMRTIGGGR